MIGATDAPEVILKKAEILAEDGKPDLARGTLENLLASPTATTQHKAKTLLLLGDLLVENEKHEKAIAYYERLYVVYGKYRDLVAKAYLRRGESLEKLDLLPEAYQVYHELGTRKDLEEFSEADKARQRASALEIHAPKPEEDESTTEEATS